MHFNKIPYYLTVLLSPVGLNNICSYFITMYIATTTALKG